LGEPLGVLDVGLSSGDLLDVAGVDQPPGEPVFKLVENRLPVIAGRLHHDQLDVRLGQPVRQGRRLTRHRGERANLLPIAPARAVPGTAHAGLHSGLADVQASDPFHDHIHEPHHPSQPVDPKWMAR
jgi:hypothetical protein